MTEESTAVVDLIRSADRSQWNEREQALAEAAGLIARNARNGTVEYAPRSVTEAFLIQARRTGLDPIARQLYCIKRGNQWGIQVSIDGARLVAQRSGEYEGQTEPEWSDGTMVPTPMRDDDGSILRDGQGAPIMGEDLRWTKAWTSDEYPKAARVGVRRRGFAAPLYAVARWGTYVVMQDEWENRQKTGRQVVSAMWAKMPDLMLSKVAEMLALRKAFPQDLSGLYSTEEMQQAGGPAEPPKVQQQASGSGASMPAQAANAPSAEDKARYVGRLLEAVAKADTLPRLTELYVAAQKGPAEGHGVLGEVVDRAGTTVEEVLWQAKERLERGSAALKDDEPVEAEVVADEESGEVGDRAAVLDEPEQEAK